MLPHARRGLEELGVEGRLEAGGRGFVQASDVVWGFLLNQGGQGNHITESEHQGDCYGHTCTYQAEKKVTNWVHIC